MTNAMRTLGKMEWQATLLLLVVFGAGIAVGAAIDHSRATVAISPMPPQAGAGRLPPYLERMDLTQDQHAKIKAILDAQRPKVDTVMNGVLPRLRALSDTTFAQIRGVLTPEQQTQFDHDRPVRDLAPGMPGAPGGRGPPRDGRGPPPRDGRGPPPRDGRGPRPERRPY
jgi:Spy/CpxP family protein refolding chaperone